MHFFSGLTSWNLKNSASQHSKSSSVKSKLWNTTTLNEANNWTNLGGLPSIGGGTQTYSERFIGTNISKGNTKLLEKADRILSVRESAWYFPCIAQMPGTGTE